MKRETGRSIFALLFPVIVSGFCLLSCDSEFGGCFGVNFEATTCPSDEILAIGQQNGLDCYRCTGQESGDQFTISWTAAPIEGSTSLGVFFLFLNTTDKWIAEFKDCGAISLFETSQGVTGKYVKGDLAGALEDINPFQIDKLSLFINIPGVRTEQAVCNFCTDSVPPRCLNTIPYLD